MEVIIISWIGSTLISIFIGNIVGIYYMNKIDKDWEQVFDKLKKITVEEIKKHMHS